MLSTATPTLATSWPAAPSLPATATGTPPARPSTCSSTSGRTPSPSRPTSATSSPSCTTPASTGCGSRRSPPATTPARSARSTARSSSTSPELTGVSIDAAAQPRAGRRRRQVGAGRAAALRARPGRRSTAPRPTSGSPATRSAAAWAGSPASTACRPTASPPIELVTAEGDLVRADAVHEPDLFWALRGGGGNFGVVTAIEFAVYPVEELYAGAMFFPFERAVGACCTRGASCCPTLPEELMTWAEPVAVPGPARGPRAGARRLVRRSSWAPSSARRPTAASCCAPCASSGRRWTRSRWCRRSRSADLAMDPPTRCPFLQRPSAARRAAGRRRSTTLVAAAGPGSGSPLAMVQLRHMGGALARKAPGARRPRHAPRRAVPVRARRGRRTRRPPPRVRASLEAVRGRAASRTASGDYPNFVEEPADASAFFDAGHVGAPARRQGALRPGGPVQGQPPHPAGRHGDRGRGVGTEVSLPPPERWAAAAFLPAARPDGVCSRALAADVPARCASAGL